MYNIFLLNGATDNITGGNIVGLDFHLLISAVYHLHLRIDKQSRFVCGEAVLISNGRPVGDEKVCRIDRDI